MTSRVVPFPSFREAEYTRYHRAPSGDYSGKRFDIWGLRRKFPERWRGFLRAHFQNPVHVAFFFSVDEKTARNWWEGTGSPRVEYVLVAIEHVPGARQMLLQVAA